MPIGSSLRAKSIDRTHSNQLSAKDRLRLVMRSVSGDSSLEISTRAGSAGSIAGDSAILPEIDGVSDQDSLDYVAACADMVAVRRACHDHKLHNSNRPPAGAKPITATWPVDGSDEHSHQTVTQAVRKIDPIALHEAMETLRISLIGGRRLAGVAIRTRAWWKKQIPTNSAMLATNAKTEADESASPEIDVKSKDVAESRDQGQGQGQGQTVTNTPAESGSGGGEKDPNRVPLRHEQSNNFRTCAPDSEIAMSLAVWQAMSALSGELETKQNTSARQNALPDAPELPVTPVLPPDRTDIAALIKELLGNVDDQQKYGAVVQSFFKALTRQDQSLINSEKQQENHNQDSPTQPKPDEDSAPIAPNDEASDQFSAQSEEDELSSSDSSDPSETLAQNDDHQEAGDSDTDYHPQSRVVPEISIQRLDNYHAYTTKYDRVIQAGAMIEDLEELKSLRASLDRYTKQVAKTVLPLALKLQRALSTPSPEYWEDNLDAGYLDVARLAKVAVKPLNPQIFRARKDIKQRDTRVTLLLDNSGSMRGYPIRITAMCAELLARTLERCRVRTEILGYTTDKWKGGDSYVNWREKGRPENPGRLNDLLHIIYKPGGVSWKYSRSNLALMLRDNLLKENIDGEALQWAVSRIRTHSESRRILIVVSDGAPVDDMTLSYNPSDYLERHLKTVARKTETDGHCELIAIGIGYDVGRFYSRALRIPDTEQLAEVLLTELIDRLGNQRRPHRRITSS